MLFQKQAENLLALPRWVKRAIASFADACLCLLTVWLAYYLRLEKPVAFSNDFLVAVTTAIGIAIPLFIVAGLYRAIFRYSGWPALLAVAKSIGIYGLLYAFLFTLVGYGEIPRAVGVIQPILLLLFVGSSRLMARLWLGNQYQSILERASRPRALIYGAGSAGRQLATAMNNSHIMQVAGFLDDDDRLHGHVLNGLSIYNPDDLFNLVESLKISNVLLAMPSLTRKRRNEVLSRISGAHVAVRTLPSVTDLAQGKVNISDLRELDIDDLLGREPVMPNHLLLAINVQRKVVMVTGAGGSIGGELCRQILGIGPGKLLLIDQSEFALYRIHQELLEKSNDKETEIVPLLASVQDSERMREIMKAWKPDTVYHAAAYKHVPLVEHNSAEGVRNNVMGTLRTAKAAAYAGVSDFVLISTDKAVRPTNIMGASKRLAEMILQALAKEGAVTRFSIVRFGNVLGSSGSVVPKFRQQIHDGGPITLTHPEITRYFMTLSEAAQLVIQAGAMAKGGDVFVLDMGQPVKIYDLARRMLELSGLTLKDEQNPAGDIEIKIIGLRPGEKLYEELLIGNNPTTTSHLKIMKAQEEFIPWVDLEQQFLALQDALDENNPRLIRSMLMQLVVGYIPTDEIVDLLYVEQVEDAPSPAIAA